MPSQTPSITFLIFQAMILPPSTTSFAFFYLRTHSEWIQRISALLGEASTAPLPFHQISYPISSPHLHPMSDAHFPPLSQDNFPSLGHADLSSHSVTFLAGPPCIFYNCRGILDKLPELLHGQ